MVKDVVIFTLILLGVLVFLGLLAYAVVTKNLVYTLVALLLAAFGYVIWKSDVLLRLKEYEKAIVFRFGKFAGVRGPGWIMIIPFVEDYVVVDMRVQAIDVPKQEVVTKDNIVLMIDAVIYLRVVDPKKAVLEVKDYKQASILFVQSMIRDLVGNMTLSELIGRIDELNDKIYKALEEMAKNWGIKVDSVQLKDIDIPERVKKAMHDMMIAEKEKQARTQRAMAKKIELEAIKEAARDMNDRVLLYFYLETLKELASGRATKIIYPLDLSTLARAISTRMGGVVPAEKVEEDLKKYKDIIEKVLK